MGTELTDCKKKYVERLVESNEKQVRSLKEIFDGLFKMAPALTDSPLAREFAEVTELINQNTDDLLKATTCEEVEDLAKNSDVYERTKTVLQKANRAISTIGALDTHKLAA